MFDLKEEYYYKGEMDEPFMIKQKKKINLQATNTPRLSKAVK